MATNIRHAFLLMLGLAALFLTWPHAFEWMRTRRQYLQSRAIFCRCDQCRSTAAFLSIDMAIAWLVFMIWVVVDTRRIGMGAKWGWFFVALSYVGVSLAFPVYLIARERFIDGRKRGLEPIPSVH